MECQFLRWSRKGVKANFRSEREERVLLWNYSNGKKLQIDQVICNVWTLTLESKGIADNFEEFAKEYDAPIKLKNKIRLNSQHAIGKYFHL